MNKDKITKTNVYETYAVRIATPEKFSYYVSAPYSTLEKATKVYYDKLGMLSEGDCTTQIYITRTTVKTEKYKTKMYNKVMKQRITL